MLDFAMDVHDGTVEPKHAGTHPKYYAAAMGFNPVELSRSAPIEMWRDRPQGRCKTFLEVAERMHKLEQTSDKFCMLNPVVGPEPVTASSRMKGGSVTKILLDATFALAAHTSLGIEPFSSAHSSSEPSTKKAKRDTASADAGGQTVGGQAVLERIVQAFETTYRETYSDGQRHDGGQQRHLTGLATVLQKCADAVVNSGHLYYVGDGCAGIMGVIDASEMPDTYGCPFDEVRAFVEGGWKAVGNADGDISGTSRLCRISLDQFEEDILPGIKQPDIVVFLAGHDLSDRSVGVALACEKRGAALAVLATPSALDTKAWPALMEGATGGANQGGEAMVVVAQLSHQELLPGMYSFEQQSLKWMCNGVSTGAQILKGLVFTNRMISTAPANNKIYHRCVDMIALFTKCERPAAEVALLRAVYKRDDITLEPRHPLLDAETSAHITVAIPNEEDKKVQCRVLPIAILLATGKYSVASATRALDEEPVVRNLILQSAA
jgi:N-acetylmuramic acid 6-phosphate (MurNAc-6-P) etherase